MLVELSMYYIYDDNDDDDCPDFIPFQYSQSCIRRSPLGQR
jgi:hypothetical protein